MEEPAWQEAEMSDGFWQNFPMDTSRTVAPSEVRLTYDDKFLYVGVKCYATDEGNYYVTPSLRRDFRGPGNDQFSFIVDPFQDQTTAFIFGINPYGVQREGLISNGGNSMDDFDLSWDNRWFSDAKIYEDYWIAEFAIPFKTLRYKEGSKEWNIQFYRLDSYTNERSTWNHVPRNFRLYSLAYTGELLWDKPLKKPGGNISVIPYVSAQQNRDFSEEEPVENFSAGGDAKIAITPSLNLDLTVNPDFSQVEVDRQVTNLDRFEIFFPERRQFFLENADLFANFGSESVRPFFSRRIGVAIDTATGVNVQNRIIGGARLSGRVNKNWRIGLLNMQTGEDKEINVPSFNYTVAAVQRQLFARSNISALFINKQSFSDSTNEFSLASGNYNRLVGLDYNLASADNTWAGKVYYHQSIDPIPKDDAYSHGANLTYSTRNWEVTWEHQIVGEGFNAEVGFTPRLNFRRISPSVAYTFYPDSRSVVSHGPGVEQQLWWKPGLGITDYNFNLFYEFSFRNTSQLTVSALNDYIYLFRPFSPAREGIPFSTGDTFNMRYLTVEYRSDTRRNFNYEINTINGQYYDGFLNSFSGTINYRFQPYGLFSLDFNYSDINLQEPYSDAQFVLIGPRLDLTFTRSVFLTTFVQYNSQFDNVNINTRFQWRFKPVSDLFIVYTDNYTAYGESRFFPDTYEKKNRGLVVKLTYWLNL
ncbi:MAG: DUF5916 domain-containing protein [Bacteroidota bacterium]